MQGRNASSSLLGWDFQINAAIIIMLDNIKDMKQIRVEGGNEDIELTLADNSKIYAQAKHVSQPDDYRNVERNLKKSIETLNDDAKNKDGAIFTYVTNSPNPFNNQQIMSFFTQKTHLYYNELPQTAKNNINKIIKEGDYKEIDLDKFDIRVIPFYGSDENNRYKEIKKSIDEFLNNIGVQLFGVSGQVMNVWQKYYFQNASDLQLDKKISKEEIMWPIIVITMEKSSINDYKNDYSDEEIEEVLEKYNEVINFSTTKYELISNVLLDYKKSKLNKNNYINTNWNKFSDIVCVIDDNDFNKELLTKIIMHRIIFKSDYISNIKKNLNL